jgi:hypothetical protein
MPASDTFVPPSKNALKKTLARYGKEPWGKGLFESLQREIDLVMTRQQELFEKEVAAKFEQLALGLTRVEGKVASTVSHHEYVALESDMRANEAIDEERAEKKVLCQWLNGFLASSSDGGLDLDRIDFAFSRFALNMAVAAGDTPVAKMQGARVPGFLVGMLASSDNDVVLGPAAIALAHLALHDEARVDIVDSGAISALVKQCRECKSPAVLAQCCKCLAALALRLEVRQRVAGEGGMAALCDLIQEATEFADWPRCTNGVRAAAMSAMVNFMFQSDANRKLMVELKGIPPVVDAAVNSPDSYVVEQAVRCLGNVSFNQPFTASAVIASRGVDSICSALECSDLHQDEAIFEAGMLALANLCNNEQNQTSVGASGACRLALHVCAHTNSAHVLKDASRLVCSLSFRSFVNKTRLGELGGLQILLGCCSRFGFESCNGQQQQQQEEEFGDAVEWCCKALASLLLHRGNQKQFRELWGLQVVVDLCLKTEQSQVLLSGAMVVSSVVPSAEDRFEAHDEGRTIQVVRKKEESFMQRLKTTERGK